MSWESKMLRRIYGPVCINDTWPIRSNVELESLYNRPDIVAQIKSRRIECLGYVLRMETSRIPQKILDGRPKGKRSIGRPRPRWLDDDVNDVRNMGVSQ
jgi:hypothetical protein